MPSVTLPLFIYNRRRFPSDLPALRAAIHRRARRMKVLLEQVRSISGRDLISRAEKYTIYFLSECRIGQDARLADHHLPLGTKRDVFLSVDVCSRSGKRLIALNQAAGIGVQCRNFFQTFFRQLESQPMTGRPRSAWN